MLSLTSAAPTAGLPDEPFVLLVDDHESCRRQLRQLVEMGGHACVPAESAVDALVYCDSRTPRAVVTDLVMPQIDGQGLARWLKARYPSVPIVLVTGQDLLESDLANLRSTFAAVLQKPIDAGHFLDVLTQLMPNDGVPATTEPSSP
jgi:CheY-like chemotaxis protein